MSKAKKSRKRDKSPQPESKRTRSRSPRMFQFPSAPTMKESIRLAGERAYEKSKEKYIDCLEAVLEICKGAADSGADGCCIKYAELKDEKLKDTFEDAEFRRTLKRVAAESGWGCLLAVSGECRMAWVIVPDTARPGVETTQEILSDIRDRMTELSTALGTICDVAVTKK